MVGFNGARKRKRSIPGERIMWVTGDQAHSRSLPNPPFDSIFRLFAGRHSRKRQTLPGILAEIHL